jgi:hypothetical protein
MWRVTDFWILDSFSVKTALQDDSFRKMLCSQLLRLPYSCCLRVSPILEWSMIYRWRFTESSRAPRKATNIDVIRTMGGTPEATMCWIPFGRTRGALRTVIRNCCVMLCLYCENIWFVSRGVLRRWSETHRQKTLHFLVMFMSAVLLP